MTADANMMNDIMEEPEKDTLLEAHPELQVSTVMSGDASPAKARLEINKLCLTSQQTDQIVGLSS